MNRRSVILFAALVAVARVAIAHAGDWPQFRGPTADGRTAAANLPLTFGENDQVRWKTAIPGKAWSSPVVWDKRIWLSTASEDGKQLGALRVDADSGAITLEKTVFRLDDPPYCHPMNSYATPTPVVEEGRIYLHFGSNGTACLDTATGNVLWSRRDLPCDHHRGAASSPILADGLLILTFDGVDQQYLAALDKHTGKTVWRRERGIQYETEDPDYHKAYSTPALITVAGRRQLVSPSAGATIAYEPATGVEIWRVRSGGMNAAALPLSGHGMVFATSAAGGMQLFAVKPDGTGDVTGSHVVWTCRKTVPSRSSLVLAGGRLFMISDNGMASCVDAQTGRQVWQKRLKGNFSASPLLAGDRVYFFSEEGAIPVIAAAGEFRLLAENRLDNGFMASPAVLGESLILRSRKHLYRIGR